MKMNHLATDEEQNLARVKRKKLEEKRRPKRATGFKRTGGSVPQ